MTRHINMMFKEVEALKTFPASKGRLRFVAKDRRLADAEDGGESLAKMLGVKVPSSWPPEYVEAPQGHKGVPWRNYYVIAEENGKQELVGIAAVAVWPEETRAAQLGAALVPEWQNRQLGHDISLAVAEWAEAHSDVDSLICDIPADRPGAAKALENSGFVRSAEAPAENFVRYVRSVG